MPALSSGTSNVGLDLWPQKDINEYLVAESPLLGLLKKRTDFNEDNWHIGFGTGTPQGVGPVFQFAKEGKTSSTADQFTIRAKTLYAIFSIEGRIIRQSKKNGALLVKPYARESKNSISQWKREMSAFLYGNGGGSIGQIDPTGFDPNSRTFRLRDPSKVRFFSRYQKLWFATGNDGSIDPGTPLPGGGGGVAGGVNNGFVTIEEISRSGDTRGTIVIKEPSLNSVVQGITANDFIFRRGVFGNVVTGIQGWIPPGKPGGINPVTGLPIPDNFLGSRSKRSADSDIYAGMRIDGRRAGGIFQCGMLAATALVDSGAKPDTWLMSTFDWNKLRVELSAAGSLTYNTTPAAGIGKYKPGATYKSIVIMGPAGEIDVFPDPDCPTGRSLMTQLDTWTLALTNELVQLVEDPMMEENADSWESRFVGDHELYNEMPAYTATLQHAEGA
ncbi:hypothetical protein [Pendulispora albinea]|uniref:Uncharacterized protein n=1 Tax=Pendulispora albinea TaxID=2741071 RepID=A0ABZ2LWY9_9BACT